MNQDFVMLKIDEDRMTGGKEVEARIRGESKGGIPWIAFLDADGRKLATSDAPAGFVEPRDKGGNIGYPDKPGEIAWFICMLRSVWKKITPEQLEQLETALRKNSTSRAPAR